MIHVSRLAAFAALATLVGCGAVRDVGGTTGEGSCALCHGDAERASNRAAPPGDAQGGSASPAVGAHLAHLDGGEVTCETCHRVPSFIGAAGHADGGTAEIVFGAAAKRGGAAPSYDPQTRRCSDTYCHGGRAAFASNVSPPWDAAPIGCDGCHASPPATHDAASTDCHTCHPGTVLEDHERIRPGGGHLDGAVAGRHRAGFSDPAAHGPVALGFLAGQADAPACGSCHGSDLAGGDVGVACDGCHAARVADWRANCTFCHGTPTEPYAADADLLLAAPPPGVSGADPDPAVGAHRTHLFGRSASAVSDGVGCADCHAVATDLTHLDGVAAVVTRRPGTAEAVGSYDAGTGTCASTYCHGNFPNGNAGNSPSWTASSGQRACGTCHAPQWTVAGGTKTDAHAAHDPGFCTGCHDPGRPDCSACHDSYLYWTEPPTVNRALHVDGAVDVIADPLVGWNPTSRGCNANCHLPHDVAPQQTW